VVLGDNFFYGQGLGQSLASVSSDHGATIFVAYVDDPSQFGVVEFNDDLVPVRIQEKPTNPASHWAIPGLYFFDVDLYDALRSVTPSARGELEIDQVIQWYLDEGRLTVQPLPRGVMWSDMGTPDALLDTSTFVRLVEQRHGLLVGSLEEVAWRNGWINREAFDCASRQLAATQYGRLLTRLLEDDLALVDRDSHAAL
jgi:glucose-1-phosphate thymidylyltransferase